MEARSHWDFLSDRDVLILIIMEDTHGGSERLPKACCHKVLILIIMEDTHGVATWCSERLPKAYLNPYYNGRYSWRDTSKTVYEIEWAVLILIIMEDTHGGSS